MDVYSQWTSDILTLKLNTTFKENCHHRAVLALKCLDSLHQLCVGAAALADCVMWAANAADTLQFALVLEDHVHLFFWHKDCVCLLTNDLSI